jgi:hypothetical protein
MHYPDYRYHEEEQAHPKAHPVDDTPVIYPEEYFPALLNYKHPKHTQALKIRAERMRNSREGSGKLPNTFDSDMENRLEQAMYGDNRNLLR